MGFVNFPLCKNGATSPVYAETRATIAIEKTITHLRINAEDSLFLEGNKIHACIEGKEYLYSLESIEKIVLLTTDLGPFYDDMGLAVDVGNNTVIFIMSEHKCFNDFLFEQIGKVLLLDYQKIIEASSSVESKAFEIYKKKC